MARSAPHKEDPFLWIVYLHMSYPFLVSSGTLRSPTTGSPVQLVLWLPGTERREPYSGILSGRCRGRLKVEKERKREMKGNEAIEMATENVQFSVMLPKPVKAALENAAAENCRSVSGEILWRLTQSLKA